MFRKRINGLLEDIGEVLDDYCHMGYDVAYYEKPKPHRNPGIQLSIIHLQ